jgi:crossover junction endodeoxyribonuclease RuvC
MRVLGIDPGLRRTGFGVIDSDGRRLRYVGSGTIAVPSGPLPQRLGEILFSVREVCQQFKPDAAAIEIVFLNTNPQSTLLLGQARGAALCGLVDQGLSVAEYAALHIKKAVVGTGRASKEQVQHMVQRLLGLSAAPSPDAADALACAICHAHTTGPLAP